MLMVTTKKTKYDFTRSKLSREITEKCMPWKPLNIRLFDVPKSTQLWLKINCIDCRRFGRHRTMMMLLLSNQRRIHSYFHDYLLHVEGIQAGEKAIKWKSTRSKIKRKKKHSTTTTIHVKVRQATRGYAHISRLTYQRWLSIFLGELGKENPIKIIV